MAWSPKTWADRPDFGGHPLDLVECPGCGRTVHADVIVDLRAVPGTVRRVRRSRVKGYAPPAVDIEWGCDACRQRLVAEGGWRLSDLYGQLGAPADVVREHRIRERAGELRRQQPRGTEFRMADLRAQAEREIPPGDDGGAP